MYEPLSSVDVVIPVYNEEACLRENILKLHGYLEKNSHLRWTIVIADNASLDKTPEIGKELAAKYNRVKYRQIPRKGRGFALRTVFLESVADAVCYMDVDFSTNLDYLKLLLEGIACGFDISIGSRLMQASRVQRRLLREIISRIYNLLTKLLFFNRFSDAQCGFKAIRTSVAKRIIPLVENNHWFFDTEMLLIAEKNHLRIFEIPVEWTDDLTSKVNIVPTIIEDISGLVRLRLQLMNKKVR
ncbi:MAG: glycosyltransferase [Candidatus Omnitrophica bacterium]|nr:glycosyltransferase [Candidatus Omnitrophota bacterium]